MLPFDRSYKSSGLAMIVELLGGLWPMAGYLDLHNEENGWGNIFIAMKPDLLSDEETFKGRVDEFLDRLRTSKTKDSQPVRIPGEMTIQARNESLMLGEVDVADELIGAVKNYIKTGDLRAL